MFKNLSIAKKYKFAQALTEILKFKKGKQLFTNSCQRKGIYLVKEGKFEIKLKQNIKDYGEQLIYDEPYINKICQTASLQNIMKQIMN